MYENSTFQTAKDTSRCSFVFNGLQAPFWGDFLTPCPKPVLRGRLPVPAPTPPSKSWSAPSRTPCAPWYPVEHLAVGPQAIPRQCRSRGAHGTV